MLHAVRATFGEGVVYSAGCVHLNCTTDTGFAAAAAAAAGKVAIVAVGTTWFCGGSGGELGYGQPAPECEMEGSDRAALGLPGQQEALVAAVAAVAAKTIVVLIAAGPNGSPSLPPLADAMVQTFFGGQATALALLDVLTGSVAPSGRLPYTVPAALTDVPPIDSYAMATPPGRTYRFATPPPLYPFGFGLSYARFVLGSLAVQPAAISPCANATVRVNVTHSAGPASAEVVQLYASWAGAIRPGSGVRPELKGFARVELQPGESATVAISLGAAEMASPSLIDLHMEVAPGELHLFVGSGQPGERLTSSNQLSASLRVVGAPRPLESCSW